MFLRIMSTERLTPEELENVARYEAIDRDARLIKIKKDHAWPNVLEEYGGREWALTFALGLTQLKNNISKDIELLSEMPVGYTLEKLGRRANVNPAYFPPNFQHRYDKAFLENLSKALDRVLKNSDLDNCIVVTNTLDVIAMYAVAYSGEDAVSKLEEAEELCWIPAGDDCQYYPSLGGGDWKTEYFQYDDIMDLVYGRWKRIKKTDPLHFDNWTSRAAFEDLR